MGRAGRWYAIEDEGVVPDLVTTAKSLGGGLPISAVTGRADLMDAVHAGGLGGTYGDEPRRGRRGARRAGQDRARGPPRSLAPLGETIMTRFRAIAGRVPRSSATCVDADAMCAIELVSDRTTKEPLGADAMNAITRALLEDGVIVITAGTYGNVIRLLPPLDDRRGAARGRVGRAGRRRSAPERAS